MGEHNNGTPTLSSKAATGKRKAGRSASGTAAPGKLGFDPSGPGSSQAGPSQAGPVAAGKPVISHDLKPPPLVKGAAVRPARASIPMGGPIPERSFATRELGALIPRLTRPAFRRRSPESAQILADWPALAGPALAAMAEPVRLSNFTLTLACNGPAAMELGMLAPMLMERLNGQLGRAAIRKIAFVQRAPRLAAPVLRRPPPGPIPPEAEKPLATLPEGELQAALARLARGVFNRR